MCLIWTGAAALLLAAANVGTQDRAAQLRRVLSLPEATMSEKMSLTMGLKYSRTFGYFISRERPDLSAAVGPLRRSLQHKPEAAGYDRLGALYDEEGRHAAAQNAYRRSAVWHRLRLARRPNDVGEIAAYSLVLLRLGLVQQAAAVLRGADAGSAAVQAAQAQILEKQADAWLGQSKRSDRAARAQTALDAAAASYDRAVRLAPRTPATWALRAGFRTFSKPQTQGRIDALRPAPPSQPAVFVSAEGITDYERAAQLDPRDPYAIAMPSWIDVGYFAFTNHTDMADRKNVPLMSAQARQRAREAVRCLKRLTKVGDRRLSARAWTALAWVQFEFYGDAGGATRSLLQALSQDPSRQDAADYLLHVPGIVGDYPLMAAACRREMKQNDTPRLHIILAYAEAKQSHFAEARRQLEVVRRWQPQDRATALALAALRMKQGGPGALTDAGRLLGEATPAFSPTAAPERRADYQALRGVYAALTDHPDQARDFLRAALKVDPANRQAKDALALMPGPATEVTR